MRGRIALVVLSLALGRGLEWLRAIQARPPPGTARKTWRPA